MDERIGKVRSLYAVPTELLVELVGGPADGRTFSAILDRDGLPLYDLRVPIERAPVWMRDPAATYPTADDRLSVEVYRRDRISEETHRWIYEHSSINPTSLAEWIDVTSPSDEARHQRRYLETRTGKMRLQAN